MHVLLFRSQFGHIDADSTNDQWDFQCIFGGCPGTLRVMDRIDIATLTLDAQKFQSNMEFIELHSCALFRRQFLALMYIKVLSECYYWMKMKMKILKIYQIATPAYI